MGGPVTYGPGSPIVVADAILPAAAIGVDEIRSALGFRRSTQRDSDFLGRSATEVYADETTVVKVRPDLAIPYRDKDPQSDRIVWIRARLERERAIDGYPDDRTWFLVDAGDLQVAGVAARRRRPIHLWSQQELAARWEWYAREFSELYLRAGEQGWRLDEGPSNFAPATEPDGRLRYLDDDLYPWDRGTGLRPAWRVLARRGKWLTAEHGALLGTVFRDELERRPPIFETSAVAADLRADAQGDRVGNAFLRALADALAAPRRARSSSRPRHGVRTVALIADIHANRDALDAVLATDDLRGADEILVLGDSVGYGPDPAEVIARLRSDERFRVLKGNHDHAMVEPESASRFTKDARWSADWTAERLSAADRAWLQALPLELAEEDWSAVHGAPADPSRFNAYIYQMTADDNLDKLELDGTSLCFYGNTHVQGAWARRIKGMPAQFLAPDRDLDASRFRNLLVCPGSVGQPRDGAPGAAYAMYDRATKTVRFERIGYDLAGLQDRMRSLGFPARLVDRLGEGR